MEFAPAKINLTLHVTGQRKDGYHLLDSLVVFADIGDCIFAESSNNLVLDIEGPEKGGLIAEKDNLVLRAARLLNPTGTSALKLQKNLPTSSGIGGGSADAAAALRLLSRHWSMPLPKDSEVLQLGADVPVCLASVSCRMRGIGEILDEVPKLPDMALLLVNPRKSIRTPDVFKNMNSRRNLPMTPRPTDAKFSEFCEWLSLQRNDLQEPAMAIEPVISEVLDAVAKSGAIVSRMSGSGATCFGVFSDIAAAKKAAAIVSDLHKEWWVKPAQVLG